MEEIPGFLLLSSICFLVVLLLFLARNRHNSRLNNSRRLPPGPHGWPVVGNMFDLGQVPHETLAGLRSKHGPVVSLRLGAVTTVVVLSAEAAEEIFKNHDLSFAGRTITEAMRACSFNQSSMALGQYGPYWRMLRRLCTTELFSNKCLNETLAVRRKSVDNMVGWIKEEAKQTGRIDVAHFVFTTVFNLVGNLMFSRDLLGPQSKEGAEFFRASSKMTEWSGTPNVADFFPFLKWLDPQRIRANMERDLGHALDIASCYIKERTENQKIDKGKDRKDFLDALLELKGETKDGSTNFSDKDVKIMILEIFLAATDTTTSTIEWAMAELLHKPELMNKVRGELDQVVGQNRKVEESDMEGLPYLQAVVKETLRLHPPIPFLIPRRAVKETEFMGYSIPVDTQVLVHAWAIGRDPDVWKDPLSFNPERFLDSNIDFKGHHFQLIPFGAGRRICAGLPLADRMLHLVLGSLLHCFEWHLVGDTRPDTMDMGERMGITLKMAVPLKAMPKPRVL